MSGSVSAVLLAAVGGAPSPLAATALTQLHHIKLKAALELPGAAIAATASAEYLGVYTSAGIALQAALAFQIAADELMAGSPLAFTARVVLDLWPESIKTMPIEQLRKILQQTRERSVLVTPAFAGAMPASERANLAHYEAPGASAVLHGVTELRWVERATSFRESTRQSPTAADELRYHAIKLSRRGKDMLVRAEDCPFSVGRDHACAIQINGPNVSRLHGALLHEGGKFYFRDDSRNGTYLTMGGEEIYLQAERFPLVAKGVISPGATLVQQTGDVIRYQCLADEPDEPSHQGPPA